MAPATKDKGNGRLHVRSGRVGKTYKLYRLHIVVCNDASDTVQMNTSLTSVLVFCMLLRQVTSRPCTMESSRHLVLLRTKQPS